MIGIRIVNTEQTTPVVKGGTMHATHYSDTTILESYFLLADLALAFGYYAFKL